MTCHLYNRQCGEDVREHARHASRLLSPLLTASGGHFCRVKCHLTVFSADILHDDAGGQDLLGEVHGDMSGAPGVGAPVGRVSRQSPCRSGNVTVTSERCSGQLTYVDCLMCRYARLWPVLSEKHVMLTGAEPGMKRGGAATDRPYPSRVVVLVCVI